MPPPDATAAYRRAEEPVEARVCDLLARMTLAEKIDQLHQVGVGDANPNNLSERREEFQPTFGSYVLNGAPDLALRNELQRRAVEESRLGIPAIFGADVIHGYRTIFPIPLAQACAWNPALVRRASRAAAEEAAAHGVDWTFAPMVDHCVDPRWGRVCETFGEAPFASSVFGTAAVCGFQDGEPSVAACLKHFAGYGASEGGRDYSYTDISPQRLWEAHLPPFEAGIRAGASTVMSGFNDLNGIPATANAYMLTEVLRTRWGFDGLVVSDSNAVQQLMRQGLAGDEAEAAQKALAAGVDIDMADGLYRAALAGLVTSGRVPLARVDTAVARVLRVKFEIGLFEHPWRLANALTAQPPAPVRLELAEEFARESIVLLKNTGVLPLAGGVRRVALLGPLAESRGALLGSWAMFGRADETPTIAEALREELPAGTTLRIEAGCDVAGTSAANFEVAVAAARDAEVAILCLGEEAEMSGENASRSTLRLAGKQEELALAVMATGVPVVVVLVTGRPLELGRIEPGAAAIVVAWQGGSRAAAALADALTGRCNPSGRLAITWPRSAEQIPVAHHVRPRARPDDAGAYRDGPTAPQYEFGHGLSYTTFTYSSIRLASATVAIGGRLRAELTVTNAGDRDGSETVLWFIRDPAASITRPLAELKHFEKAALCAGESRVYGWEIEPARDLAFPDADGRAVLEPGEIVVRAGPSAARFAVVAANPI